MPGSTTSTLQGVPGVPYRREQEEAFNDLVLLLVAIVAIYVILWGIKKSS